ncbi:hypothetical protein EVJ32_09600 [Exiguobacterium sp. SH5S4]|uniref:hypothetical protein n=1 Tax=Exiguobacterium sp. SH5S4 TaxID=2510961 RepID=UPI00103B0713|nr:hypothetical protein [Exiguobacterium sp. SH5S4]TCI25566.1 hypothetical protein EVJ32_09600 [Exiguobacterium sp. SH5S4]
MPTLRFLEGARLKGRRFKQGETAVLSNDDVNFLVGKGLGLIEGTLDPVHVSEQEEHSVDVAKVLDENWTHKELLEDIEEAGIEVDKSLNKGKLIAAIIESDQADKLLEMLEEE